MAEAISEEHFHDYGRERGYRCVCDGFHACKTCHAITAYEVAFGPFESSVVASGTCVRMHYRCRGSGPKFAKISNPLFDPQKCSDMFNLLKKNDPFMTNRCPIVAPAEVTSD